MPIERILNSLRINVIFAATLALACITPAGAQAPSPETPEAAAPQLRNWAPPDQKARTATPAPAGLPDTVQAYQIVFDAWVKKHRPQTGVVVVRRQGKTVFARGHAVDPHALSLIGSMSKPITGACIGTLVRDGKLAFTTPMRQALAGFFRRNGPPPDRRFETVTVEQLLMHRSGLRGNDDQGDPIHAIWQRRADAGMAYLASPEPLLVEHLKTTRLQSNPGTKETYSNTGFVVLTAVIEEATGKAFETYCHEAVLARLGITSAKLHPDWRTFSGAGGYFITGADYLTFLEIFDRKHPFFGDAVKTWIDKGQTRWDPNNRDDWYSLGIPTTNFSDGWRVLHGGMLNSRGRGPNGQPIAAIIHSFGYREPRQISVFHAMTPVREDDALGDLDHTIHRTHDVVKNLP